MDSCDVTIQIKPLQQYCNMLTPALNATIPSGCLFEVAITTTPCSNKEVNNLFKIIASAMSVTCKKQKRLVVKPL